MPEPRSAAGLDHCLVPSVIASDITVCSASGLFAKQVAEQPDTEIRIRVVVAKRLHGARRRQRLEQGSLVVALERVQRVGRREIAGHPRQAARVSRELQ